ncbi:MAG: hypothetical protein OHK93_004380 [Ramalina farinacea]|uniref:Uncharacterized protein n=1 Tax=Ramalina farinacea TaxID=258253 RepID=A0AA43TYL9_9LECA|nr:hypothetical protein [Ramalina farinacea]
MSNLNAKHTYPTHRSTILPTPTTNTTTNPPTTPYTHHSTTNSTSLNPSSSSSSSSSTSSINRNRQYSHLHAQLAQLNAQMADMENLVGMTAVQAGFMAASKVLGEETANAGAAGGNTTAAKKE